jgi:hypothetical protein
MIGKESTYASFAFCLYREYTHLGLHMKEYTTVMKHGLDVDIGMVVASVN